MQEVCAFHKCDIADKGDEKCRVFFRIFFFSSKTVQKAIFLKCSMNFFLYVRTVVGKKEIIVLRKNIKITVYENKDVKLDVKSSAFVFDQRKAKTQISKYLFLRQDPSKNVNKIKASKHLPVQSSNKNARKRCEIYSSLQNAPCVGTFNNYVTVRG